MSIIARKGKLQKTFSDLSWENLGENKYGWEEVKSGSTTSNITAKAVQTPPTGQLEKKEAPVANATTSDISKKEEAPKTENTVEASEDEKVAKFLEESKAKFSESAKELGITKNFIKDYFDKEENSVPYKAADSLDVLIGLLFENLNGDIELLKSKFSL
jgi:hypothetical protein